jgi:hypothetical protein
MEIHEQPVRYAVSAVPLEWLGSRHFTVHVQCLRSNEWVVERYGEFLTPAGQWTFVTAERGKFELEEALEMAREAAPHLTVNEYTVADALTKGSEWY